MTAIVGHVPLDVTMTRGGMICISLRREGKEDHRHNQNFTSLTIVIAKRGGRRMVMTANNDGNDGEEGGCRSNAKRGR